MSKAKRPKFVAVRTRQILGKNVRAGMEKCYKNESNKVKSLAEDAGVSRSTVQRALAGTGTGITVDTLHQIALALRVKPYELLLPADSDT